VDLKRGKTFCKFLTLGSLEVYEDEVWQICAHDNFCSTFQHVSTLKVSGISDRSFLGNAGKGGGPHKKKYLSNFEKIFYKNQNFGSHPSYICE
jgi:hypothetical protein